MSIVDVYLAGAITTLLITMIEVIYFRKPLHAILVDLCGTAERANFWRAFSNVTFALIPLVFALEHSSGDAGEGRIGLREAMDAFTSQLSHALVGLIVSVLAMGVILSAYIPRRRAETSEKEATISPS